MSTFIVTGHDRSGTSMVAGILHHLGVDMGESKFRSADEANQKGYFENSDFVTNNIKILESEKGLSDCRKLVEKHKTENWGVKDPRFIYTLQYYIEYMSNPKMIVSIRHPESVIDSIHHYDNRGYTHPKERVDITRDVYRYMGELSRLDSWYDIPILFVSYEKLLDKGGELDKLCDFVGIDKTKEVEDFISNDLKHF